MSHETNIYWETIKWRGVYGRGKSKQFDNEIDQYWGQEKCVHICFCTCLKECHLLFIETILLHSQRFDVEDSLGHFMSCL